MTAAVTVFGVAALSFMMAMYALESRGRVFIALFALGCAASSGYGFLAGTWPFGVVEAVWALIAVRRWAVRGRPRPPGGITGHGGPPQPPAPAPP